MAKTSTQDKVRAAQEAKTLLWYAGLFKESDDLGDKADRYGPEMVKSIERLCKLMGWER